MARNGRRSSTGTKRTASGAKSSKSSASSGESRSVRHVVCVDNDGYEASLERRKIYSAIADSGAARVGMVRVIDESGEDYLFPKECFADIKVPPRLAKALGTSA